MSYRGVVGHVGEDDLVELAHCELAPERLEGVLAHIAACDICSERSARIHRIDNLWEDWQERIHETELVREFSWVTAAVGAVRDILSRLRPVGWISHPSMPEGILAFGLTSPWPTGRSAAPASGGMNQARGARAIVLRSGQEATAEVLRDQTMCTILISGWPGDSEPPVVRLVTGASEERLSAQPGPEFGEWRCFVDTPPAGAAILIWEAADES